MRRHLPLLFTCLAMLLFPWKAAHAGDGSRIFWVDDDGAQTTWTECESAAPLSGAAACTLDTANASAAAGHTVNLREGTYSGQTIQPAQSGTAEDARIIFTGYAGENVMFSDSSDGIYLEGISFVTVNGISFENMQGFVYIYSGNHNTISNCNFDLGIYGDWAGGRISQTSQYNWIHHCRFTRWAGEAYDGHRGSLLDIGDNFETGDDSFYNLIEDNLFAYGGHHTLGVYAFYNVIRNNYIHNESWDWEGYRGAITEGPAAGRCLYEGNRFAYAFAASGFALRSWKNIVRFNAFYHNGEGGLQVVKLADSAQADYNHIYNNVFYNNGQQSDYMGFAGGIYFADWGEGDPTGNVVKNNIPLSNRNGLISTDAVDDPQVVENNWNDNSLDPGFVNLAGDDPTDPSLPDFHLAAGSPAIDAGTWLTTITSPDGTADSFTVADADYFMDGWGIIEGDAIQLDGQTETANITSVDYDTLTITVDRPLTFVTGQGVALVYNGAAPDLGMYEFSDVPPADDDGGDDGADGGPPDEAGADIGGDGDAGPPEGRTDDGGTVTDTGEGGEPGAGEGGCGCHVVGMSGSG